MGLKSGPSSTSSLSSSQKTIDRMLSEVLKNNLTKQASAYPTGIFPGMDQLFNQARWMAENQYKADKFQTGIDKAMNWALSGQPSFQITPQMTQRYFQDSVMKPMMRTFNETIKPQIQEGFAGVGAFSSRLGAELSRANQSMGTDLTNAAAQLAMNDRNLSMQLAESAANRRMSAIGQAADLRARPLQEAGMLAQLGQPFQQQANLQAQAQYQEWQRLQPENSPWMNMGMSYIGQPLTAMYQGKNPIGGAIGGAMGGAMLGSQISTGAAAGALGGLTSFAGPFGVLGALGGMFM